MKTRMKNYFKSFFIIVFVLIFSIDNFTNIVSEDDGASFVTKAEFDKLRNSFQSQISVYNTSIDSKIDGAIAEYLAGIKKNTSIRLLELYSSIVQAYGGEILWGSYTDNEVLNTKNDAVPCGTEHFAFYSRLLSNTINSATYWVKKIKVTSSQFLCNNLNNEIIDYAPDISWWLHVLHAETGAYGSGKSPWLYTPWSTSDSHYCYLGLHPMKLGYNYISTGSYSSRTSYSSWILDQQGYYLQMSKGNNFGKRFLMLPNYDGRGRGGNAWLTNQDYNGEYRTRWDHQGYHTTVDTVTDVSGDKTHIYASTKPWDKSTGNYVTGYSYKDGTARFGTYNDYQLGQEQMVADAKYYLGGYDANIRKEIYPELSNWGYVDSSAMSLDWGLSGTVIPSNTSLWWYVQMFMWLEGNRVSSDGKKISELTLSKVRNVVGLDCTMQTGLPIAKSDLNGDVTIKVSGPKEGTFVCYKGQFPSSTEGTVFTATGSNIVDSFVISNVSKNDYIFIKYLPNDDGTLGYPLTIHEVSILPEE